MEVFNNAGGKFCGKGAQYLRKWFHQRGFNTFHWSGCGSFLAGPRCNFSFSLQMKIRLDKLLVDRGLAASRERAQALILAGKVLVDGQKLGKAGAQVESGAEIRRLGEDLKYVGR